MATVIDTHKIARRYKEAGVPDAQTEAFLETIVELRAAELAQLATKDDLRAGLAELKADMLRWLVPLLSAQLLALLAQAGGTLYLVLRATTVTP